MKQKRTREYARCFVCKCKPSILIVSGGSTFFLCEYCDNEFFSDLMTGDAKIDRLIKAMKLAQEKTLHLGYALNVVRGRYGLREAKRRCRLKNREKEGKSVDIFVVGRRMPGGYK